MLSIKYISRYFFFISLALCTLFFVSILLKLDHPLDTGDGLTHFFISKASFENPLYFLHHWGKPFFILATSSFAQFGFQGVIVFNIIVFIASNLILFKLAKDLKISYILLALFPCLYVCSYEIAHTVLSGMTEPFFNLILIIAFYFLVKKNWFWFAFIVGLCPFLRSEGQLVVLLSALILVGNKEWKYLLILGIPFLIYAIIGLFAFGDFWWYFTQSPYHIGNDIYGHGTWLHYFEKSHFYLSYFGLLIVFVGFLATIYLLVKKEFKVFLSNNFIFAYFIFLGILGAHVIFWAKGINASIGLLRLATQGLPLFLFINLMLISTFFHSFQRKKILKFGFFILALVALFYSPRINIASTKMESNLVSLAKYLKDQKVKGLIHYQHPLLPFMFDENIFLKGKKTREFITSNFKKNADNLIKEGDFIFWDPHTSIFNTSFAKDTIEQFSEFVLVENYGDRSNEVRVYQKIYKNKQLKSFPKEEFQEIVKNKKVVTKDEFYDLFQQSKKLSKSSFVVAEIYVEKSDELFLSMSANNGQVQRYFSLKNGKNIVEVNLRGLNNANIFIWNKNKKPYKLVLKSLSLKTVILHPLIEF